MNNKLSYLTPGPTQINTVAQQAYTEALSSGIASISHRGEKFQKINLATKKALRELMSIPNEYRIFWLSSGTEAWERIIENGVTEFSHHFVNGAFSERFYKISLELSRKASKSEVAWFETFSGNEVVPEKAELIALTHNETSTGVMLDKSFISAVAARYPDKLIAVDMVSSAPYADLPWQNIDYAFFSVQKFFGMPAGLGALIVSPRALEKSKEVQKKKGSTGSYHSFNSLVSFDDKNETPATPNVTAIYVLGKVSQAMLENGIEQIRKETDENAAKVYAYLEKNNLAKPAVIKNRSATVLCLEDLSNLRATLEASNIIIGSGYGAYSKSHVRIANFWQMNILKCCDFRSN